MSVRQAGLFTPLFVAIVLIVAAAMMPLPPSKQVVELEKLRYEHSVWWFWQQAAAHYYRKFDVWPQSLTELALTFDLTPAPDFLSGFAEQNGFRLSWTQLSATQIELLKNGLSHPHVELSEDQIDAVMGMSTPLNEVEGIYRSESSTMASNLSLDSHNIVRARDVYVREAEVKTPSEPDRLRTTTATMAWLAIDSHVTVDKIAPNPLRVDELTKLLNEINQQYSKLAAHMESEPEGPTPYQSSSEY
ncbi:hypothetical protein LG272_05265 [Pseudidiomarina marina]|uniref:hypothetical protein n=1 Tax=Pseudidiomarina marina TaxID=502366 RepID=UPI00384AADC0